MRGRSGPEDWLKAQRNHATESCVVFGMSSGKRAALRLAVVMTAGPAQPSQPRCCSQLPRKPANAVQEGARMLAQRALNIQQNHATGIMCWCWPALGEEGSAEAGSSNDCCTSPAQPAQVLLRAAQEAGKGCGE